MYNELKSQKYRPKKSKRITIPQPNESLCYLGIARHINKTVQAVILNKLEPLFENIFLDESYGFRPKRGCHDALKAIKYK